jgi:hypothetical protein
MEGGKKMEGIQQEVRKIEERGNKKQNNRKQCRKKQTNQKTRKKSYRKKEGRKLKSAENPNISRLTWVDVQRERCQSGTQITKSQ